MGPLKQGVTLYLDQADLGMILAEQICSFISLFKGLECYRVKEETPGRFRIDLAPPLPKAQPKPPMRIEPAPPVVFEDETPPKSENQQRVEAGIARAAALTPERRSEIARKAVNTRWERARAAKETRQ